MRTLFFILFFIRDAHVFLSRQSSSMSCLSPAKTTLYSFMVLLFDNGSEEILTVYFSSLARLFCQHVSRVIYKLLRVTIMMNRWIDTQQRWYTIPIGALCSAASPKVHLLFMRQVVQCHVFFLLHYVSNDWRVYDAMRSMTIKVQQVIWQDESSLFWWEYTYQSVIDDWKGCLLFILILCGLLIHA